MNLLEISDSRQIKHLSFFTLWLEGRPGRFECRNKDLLGDEEGAFKVNSTKRDLVQFSGCWDLGDWCPGEPQGVFCMVQEEKQHCLSWLAWGVTSFRGRQRRGWPVSWKCSTVLSVCTTASMHHGQYVWLTCWTCKSPWISHFSSLASAFPSVWWGCWRCDWVLALSPESSMVQSCCCLSTDTLC